MTKEFMYVKLTKYWGGFNAGDVVRFGYGKGESRVAEGFGKEVPEQSAVNAPIDKKPIVETADRNPIAEPETETADVTPKKAKKVKKPKAVTDESDMPAQSNDPYKRARNK